MDDYHVEDCKALLSELKQQERRLRLKRRWLMDLPLSEKELKRIKKLNPLSDKSIPETMLREDDVYYDSIKDFVERGSGLRKSVKEHNLASDKLFETRECVKNLLSLLDHMTNKGLCSLCEIVTEGLLEFEKTKSKMKRGIKKYLPSYLDSKNNDLQTRKDQISSLLNSPEYFFGNLEGLCSPTESFRAGAIRMLDILEELPAQALLAMHRKLNGKTGSIPKLEQRKTPDKRALVPAVRRSCFKMLSELDEEKEPPEILVKALSIAGLTLKLILGHPYVTEFNSFSPQVEALQNDIANAIGHIDAEKKVDIKDLEEYWRKLHHLSEPKVQFSKRSMRFALKSLLAEYLFECSDMESIPETLIEVLNEINKRSHPSSSSSTLKNEAGEEVEFLLCLSAQIKQIIWDILPDAEVDQDFASAYMDEPEDSDEELNTNEVHASQNFELDSYDGYRLTESIGENKPDSFESPISTSKTGDSLLLSSSSRWNLKRESLNVDEWESFWSNGSGCSDSKPFSTWQSFNSGKHLLASLEEVNETKTDESKLTSNQNGYSCKYGHESARGLELKGKETGHNEDGRGTHHYLPIQRACDETAMAMYCVIDGMLNEFAQARRFG